MVCDAVPVVKFDWAGRLAFGSNAAETPPLNDPQAMLMSSMVTDVLIVMLVAANVDGEKAYQISVDAQSTGRANAVRLVQVKPPPVTEETLIVPDVFRSTKIARMSNSLGAPVETITVAAVPPE